MVKVTRNYDTDSIVVTQKRFLEDITLSIEEEGIAKCWWIPLSFTIANEMAWLECDETGKSVPHYLTDVIGNDTWIIFNIQLSGIYRMMYDPKSCQQIGETLKSDQLKKVHVLNRGQSINDVLSLALAGYHSYDVVFDVLEYLYNEWEYLP